MTIKHYYDLLNISPDDPIEKIRSAYHLAAKRNHPDLFPESIRSRQQLKMMKINEAYLSIIAGGASDKREPESPFNVIFTPGVPGPLKDPAYVYYKQGFWYFSKGQRIFYDRYKKEERRLRYVFDRSHLLELATEALRYFEKAYRYFLEVTDKYPDSMWSEDAGLKLRRLDNFNSIYRKICINLTQKKEKQKH